MISKISITFLIFFFLLLHIGAVLAFVFFFDLTLLLWSLFFWQFFALIGISVCYHREITHRSFKSRFGVKIFHLICAMLAGQAGPIMWAQVHRIHHKYSDQNGDPHSPIDGLLKAHLGWIFKQHERKDNPDFKKIPKDLESDLVLNLFQRLHFPAFIIVFSLLYYLGGLPYLLWLGCFRVTLTLHSAWVINSLGHHLGYQNYPNMDLSRNNHIIALLTGGEGYHNNHHKYPRKTNMAHKENEFDMAYQYIKLLEKLNLITDVKH